MPRARVLALIVGLLALAAVVAAWSLRADDPAPRGVDRRGEPTAGSDRLSGPDVPQEGVLPGRLWIVVPGHDRAGSTCEMRAVDLGALELEPPGQLTHCTLVDVSSDGRYAVAYDDRLRLALLDLRDRPEWARDLDTQLRENSSRTTRIAALAGDGAAVAWCVGENETAVLTIETGSVQSAVGCDPRFGRGGQVFTRTGAQRDEEIRVDGRVILAQQDFREGLGLSSEEEPDLLAYDVGSDGSIATKVRRVIGLPQPTIQLWHEGQLQGFYQVSGLDAALQSSGLELSPDATRVALGWRGLLAGVLDFGFGRVGRTADHGSYAWSPDGRWLAIGNAESVSIYARGSDAPTYSLPVTTLMIAWSE